MPIAVVDEGASTWFYDASSPVGRWTLPLSAFRDAASILALCDIFWLASDFEGQSNSLMEAMAAARPVIVSDIASNRELVSHEETGLAVPVTDRAEFAKAAVRLLGDEDLAKQLGSAARDRMAKEFSIRQMVESHAEIYRTVARKET